MQVLARAFSMQACTNFRVVPHPLRVFCAKGGRPQISESPTHDSLHTIEKSALSSYPPLSHLSPLRLCPRQSVQIRGRPKIVYLPIRQRRFYNSHHHLKDAANTSIYRRRVGHGETATGRTVIQAMNCVYIQVTPVHRGIFFLEDDDILRSVE